MTKKSIDERRYTLERRKKYLTNRLENIEDELDDKPDPNWSENAQAAEDDEVLGKAFFDQLKPIFRPDRTPEGSQPIRSAHPLYPVSDSA